jgi:hypothetical protein
MTIAVISPWKWCASSRCGKSRFPATNPAATTAESPASWKMPSATVKMIAAPASSEMRATCP